MAYLQNRTINRLNLHYGISSLAMSGGGVFYAVFLLRAGVPAHFVFGALALLVGFRFLIRPSVLIFGKRWGLKPLVIFGTVACAFQYPLLGEVQEVDRTLLALCIVSAIGDTFTGRATTHTMPRSEMLSSEAVRSAFGKRWPRSSESSGLHSAVGR
jgi:DHA1 family inner membrane transport protein